MSLEYSPGREKGEAAKATTPFLTQPEASEFLRVSERTLERWRVEGSGPPFVKMGRRVLYRVDDALAYAESRVFHSTSDADASQA